MNILEFEPISNGQGYLNVDKTGKIIIKPNGENQASVLLKGNLTNFDLTFNLELVKGCDSVEDFFRVLYNYDLTENEFTSPLNKTNKDTNCISFSNKNTRLKTLTKDTNKTTLGIGSCNLRVGSKVKVRVLKKSESLTLYVNNKQLFLSKNKTVLNNSGRVGFSVLNSEINLSDIRLK